MASDPAELARTRLSKFVHRGGRWYVDGKVYFPDFLALEMTRDDAFDVAMMLLMRVQHPPRDVKDADETIRVTLPGQLSPDPED